MESCASNVWRRARLATDRPKRRWLTMASMPITAGQERNGLGQISRHITWGDFQRMQVRVIVFVLMVPIERADGCKRIRLVVQCARGPPGSSTGRLTMKDRDKLLLLAQTRLVDFLFKKGCIHFLLEKFLIPALAQARSLIWSRKGEFYTEISTITPEFLFSTKMSGSVSCWALPCEFLREEQYRTRTCTGSCREEVQYPLQRSNDIFFGSFCGGKKAQSKLLYLYPVASTLATNKAACQPEKRIAATVFFLRGMSISGQRWSSCWCTLSDGKRGINNDRRRSLTINIMFFVA